MPVIATVAHVFLQGHPNRFSGLAVEAYQKERQTSELLLLYILLLGNNPRN